MKKSLVASLAVASTIGFFTPLCSHAFGLGQIELKSALNQPLKAEIDVTALAPADRDNLEIRMASAEEFSKAGLDRPYLFTKFQFEIVEDNGKTKIIITTKDAVKEPFLDFLLTATTGKGQLLREYTVLLDPPEYIMADLGRPTSAKAEPVEESNPVQLKSSSNQTTYQYQSSSYSSNHYGPVKRTDTLWNIARETRPNKDVSVNQMMIALVNENPNAFTRQNINGLQAGRTLKIPSEQTINSISHAQALAEVKRQNSAWQNRNKPVAKTADETTPEQQNITESPVSTDSEPVISQQSDSSASVEKIDAAQDEPHLNLVAPEEVPTSNQDASTSTMGSSEVDKIAEQLTLAQETIEAQAQENVDFQARMQALEEQVQTLRRMISIKDADLARLQDILEEEKPDVKTEVSSEPALPEEAPAVMDSESTSDVSPASDIEAIPATQTKEDVVSDESNVITESVEDETANILSDTANALGLDSEEVQSAFEQVKTFIIEHKLESALGILLFLLILVLISRRRSKAVSWNEAMEQADVESQTDITDAPLQEELATTDIDDESLPPPAVTGKTAGELIEQADMFVGYADYVQAKSSLEQALTKEPNNSLAIHKLLFVLYKQQQTEAFIKLVEESDFNAESLEWDEISQWGRSLAPNLPLFNDTVEATEASVESVETELEKTIEDEPAVSAEESLTEETDDSNNIAFDLNDFASDDLSSEEEIIEDEVEAVVEKDNVLDFNLNEQVEEATEETLSIDDLDLDSENDAEVESVEEETQTDSDEEDDDGLLSFDLDIASSEDNTDEHDDLANFSLDSVDDSESSLDDFAYELPDEGDETETELDLGDIDSLDDIDEAETKLDLAAAYMDMDDIEGAKSILTEVLSEGNDDQKNRAQEMLDSLS